MKSGWDQDPAQAAAVAQGEMGDLGEENPAGPDRLVLGVGEESALSF